MIKVLEEIGYIIYYTDSNGESEGFTVYGSDKLFKTIKWLNNNIKAQHIEIYKKGKNFDKDKDDVVGVYRQYWK